MAEYLTRDLKLGISALPESTYNTMRTASTDRYLGMLMTGRSFYIPDKEKRDDTGKVGTGREFPTEQRSGYVSPPSLELAEELNIDNGAVLLRRAMGGTDAGGSLITTDSYSTAAENAYGFYNHTWGLQTSAGGRQLPSSSLLWSLGGADYVWGGVVVDSFKIDQNKADVPVFTATLVGSGMNRRVRYLTADGNLAVNGSNAYNGPYAGATLTEYPPSFPAPTPQRYMLGAETICQFNDGSNSVITDAQRLKNFTMTLSNNNRTDDRRPGDPRIASTLLNESLGSQTIGDPKLGHYINRLLHGDRQVVGEVTVVLDDVLAEFSDAYNDTIVTSFKYTSQGNLLKSAELQTITHTAGPSTFTFGGQTTGSIALGATAAALQTELETLSSIGKGNVIVTRTGAGPYVYAVYFVGSFLETNVAAITYTGGTVGVVETRAGGSTSALDNQSIFEIIFPKLYFRSVRGADDNGDATITIALFPVDDQVNGPMTARIVNNTITSIV